MKWPSRILHKVPMILFGTMSLLLVSLFLAPATLDEGEVMGLDGGANMIDYWDQWSEMGPFHKVMYTFGDFNCHQKEDRSIIINGNQMPLCARDVAIFLGMGFGSLLLVRARADDSPMDTGLSILPRKLIKGRSGRIKVVIGVMGLGLLLLPTALDGGIQMISSMGLLPGTLSYESTNPTRLLTGFPTGIAVGLIYSSLLMALFSRREDGLDPLIKVFS
ncbi:MAG: DUF2085 domain-containing protein [Thermoplasmata archaeon]|nr:DUF2085 domain-containing protein [Thermoplasmata archaeon]